MIWLTAVNVEVVAKSNVKTVVALAMELILLSALKKYSKASHFFQETPLPAKSVKEKESLLARVAAALEMRINIFIQYILIRRGGRPRA